MIVPVHLIAEGREILLLDTMDAGANPVRVDVEEAVAAWRLDELRRKEMKDPVALDSAAIHARTFGFRRRRARIASASQRTCMPSFFHPCTQGWRSSEKCAQQKTFSEEIPYVWVVTQIHSEP